MVEYPSCKKCGASHAMGLENMETGEIEPLDICKKCMWITTCEPIIKQIDFDDLPKVCIENILQQQMNEILKTVFVEYESKIKLNT